MNMLPSFGTSYQSQLANIMEKWLTDRSLTQQLIKGLPYRPEFRQAIKMLDERERSNRHGNKHPGINYYILSRTELRSAGAEKKTG